MSEVKHTRAPWILGDDYKGLYGAGPNNEILKYDSYEGMWLAYENTREANARLIAAAPELLEALKSIVMNEKWDFRQGIRQDVLIAADAAIAKATGGQL